MRYIFLFVMALKLTTADACLNSLSASIPATADTAYGIPAKSLDSSLSKVTVLSQGLFCETAEYMGSREDLPSIKFKVEADFNGNGKPDTAFVGTYVNSLGGTGMFLAVVEDLGGRSQKVLFVKLDDSSDRASHLSLQGNVLSWWACFECDFSLDFRFGKTGFERIYQSDDEG